MSLYTRVEVGIIAYKIRVLQAKILSAQNAESGLSFGASLSNFEDSDKAIAGYIEEMQGEISIERLKEIEAEMITCLLRPGALMVSALCEEALAQWLIQGD